MARLSRSYTQPSRELSYSTPLPQPFCEPVRLFCAAANPQTPSVERLRRALRPFLRF